jgi:malate synthase
MAMLKVALPAEAFDGGRFAEAVKIFTDMSLSDGFEEFLTLPAYRVLD